MSVEEFATFDTVKFHRLGLLKPNLGMRTRTPLLKCDGGRVEFNTSQGDVDRVLYLSHSEGLGELLEYPIFMVSTP